MMVNMVTGKKVSAIDLFCGTGGLSLGLQQGGIDIKAGIDNAASCQYPYEINIGADFYLKSITDVQPADLNNIWGDDEVRLLAGCAPCQPFSSQRRGTDTSGEPSWPLLLEFSRLIKGTKPDYVTMENVPRIKSSAVFQQFVNTLYSLGYSVDYSVLFGPDFGLPQRRRRFVLLAALNTPIQLPSARVEAGAYKTVRSAIGDLPPLKSGQRSESDSLHFARNLTAINIRRVHASKPGGTWLDWPEELLLNCQKRESGRTFKAFYGRMEWDKPSPTITTESYNPGAGRFVHPDQDRGLTLREAACLQGFPKDFVFTSPNEKVSMSKVGRLIGNAVPPQFGKAIAEQILEGTNE